MADNDKPKSGLETWLEEDLGDAEKLLEGEHQQSDEEILTEQKTQEAETPPEEAPPKEEPPPETPPKEEPSPEAPKEEEPPVEQKVAPGKQPSERERRDAFAWKELRRLRREQRQRDVEEQRAREAKPPAPAPKAPDETDDLEIDPIEKANRDAAEAKRIAEEASKRTEEADRQARQRFQQQEIRDEIARQEATFTTKNPDYQDAMNYVVETRKQEFDMMGKLDADADMWIRERPDIVERHAEETGRDPDDWAQIREAAKDLSFRIAIHHEREQLVQYCRRTGKDVAATVYGLAERMGYKAKAAEEPPPAAPAVPTPQEKVQKAKQQAKKQESFTQSLATMQGNNAPKPKVITSREELMQLPEKELDALIAKMDKENPNWFENLED